MKNIKTIIVTSIVSGSIFIGVSVYSAIPAIPSPAQQAIIKHLENKNEESIPKIQKEEDVINITVPKITLEERLTSIEKRLEALESK